MNILIVDDEMPAVSGILKIIDWPKLSIGRTFTAHSMEAAVKQFMHHKIDIMLTDIEMGGASGLDLMSWVNAQGLPCVSIILSSFANFHYAQRAISLGVFEYLLKPVEDSQLEATLRRAIAHRQSGESAALSPSPSAHPSIEKIKHYIYSHIAQEISRNEIANHVNFNPEYLSTFFRKETGITLSDYIKAERITLAKRLLRQTNLPISMISENVGYDSLSYFSSVFHQQVGLTPREYRKRDIEQPDAPEPT